MIKIVSSGTDLLASLGEFTLRSTPVYLLFNLQR
jgi:hypothetical protein